MLLSTVWLYTGCTTYGFAMNGMARDSETPDWLSSYFPQGQILRKYKLSVCMVNYIYIYIYIIQSSLKPNSTTDLQQYKRQVACVIAQQYSFATLCPTSLSFPQENIPPPFKNVIFSVSLLFKNSVSLKLPNLKLSQSRSICVKSWL